MQEENNWIGKAIIGLIAVVVVGAIYWGLQEESLSETREVSIEITEEDHIQGSFDAPVTLVEYSDFQCPACRGYEPIIKEVLDEYSDDELRFVYRHFPLRSIHPNANIAAQAAEAAAEEGKFWEMKDILFDKQAEWSGEEDPRGFFGAYAAALELDVAEFDEDLLPEDDSRERVEEDYQSGIAIGINSTPTFILNGLVIRNPQSARELKLLIDEELEKAQATEEESTEEESEE